MINSSRGKLTLSVGKMDSRKEEVNRDLVAKQVSDVVDVVLGTSFLSCKAKNILQ